MSKHVNRQLSFHPVPSLSPTSPALRPGKRREREDWLGGLVFRLTHLHMKNARTAEGTPAWMRLRQYSIFVLAGPHSAWQTLNTSSYWDRNHEKNASFSEQSFSFSPLSPLFGSSSFWTHHLLADPLPLFNPAIVKLCQPGQQTHTGKNGVLRGGRLFLLSLTILK